MVYIQPGTEFGSHQIYVRFWKHGGMIAGNSVEVESTPYQISPSQSEVEIRAFWPIARLEQRNFPRVRLRLITMKRRMNDEIRIVGPVPISILPTRNRQLPYGSFDFAPCFVQSIEKVSRALLEIGTEKIREMVLHPSGVTTVGQRICVIRVVVTIKHGDQRDFFPVGHQLLGNLIRDYRIDAQSRHRIRPVRLHLSHRLHHICGDVFQPVWSAELEGFGELQINSEKSLTGTHFLSQSSESRTAANPE